MLIDTHAHLNDEKLAPIAAQIVAEMPQNNLKTIINVGYDRQSSELAYQQSVQFEQVFSAVGIHPHDSKTATQADYDYFSAISGDKKVVAYGEIGLDYFYDLSEKDVQKRVLVEQLELASSLKLPVIFHLRDAYNDMFNILKDNAHYLTNGAVLHCYMGSAEMIKQFNRFDMFYSFGGAVTFKNANKGDIVRSVPTERLLLETDCPYMTPMPYRGQPNQPKYISFVRDKIAEFLPNIDVETVTTNNAETLFKGIR